MSSKITLVLSEIDKAKLAVLAWHDRRTVSAEAADMLSAVLSVKPIQAKLLAAARTMDPRDTNARLVLGALEPTKTVAPKVVPAPALTPAPTPAVSPPAPAEELSAEPQGVEQPIFDVAFLAPPDSRPGQRVVATPACASPIEEG